MTVQNLPWRRPGSKSIRKNLLAPPPAGYTFKRAPAGAGRGRCEQPISTPIRLSAFEVLSFFAAHGRTRGARMLRLTVPKVNELLHDVAREIDAARG